MADELQRIFNKLEHLQAVVEDLRQDMRENTQQVTDLRLWRAKVEGVLTATRIGTPLIARIVIPVFSATIGALIALVATGPLYP